jgi:hypothetical protein
LQIRIQFVASSFRSKFHFFKKTKMKFFWVSAKSYRNPNKRVIFHPLHLQIRIQFVASSFRSIL